ncbi:MAG: HTTM domain-containing protein [Candidatus Dadabacteria bacterium]|nr:HTTM domain-containing protein [Candidatus Dadabacteria bacterium]
MKTLLRRLFDPVDIASLIYFRIAFGLIMFWEIWRYFKNDWIKTYWIDPTFYFTYYGFDWVQPWPGDGMYIHFIVLAVLVCFIILGLFYRISAVLFFLGFSYVFLLDQTRYLNHFYLISLISFIMIFAPAHRSFSLDAVLRPNIRSNVAPAWTLWLLRFQIFMPYFYGGLAKLNSDWLHGQPMRMWLADRSDFPVIGQLFTNELFVSFFNYGGLFFDLLIIPLLLWRRTRVYAVIAAVVFHLMNAWLWNIGIFPWFMIAATLMFLSPDWPRRLIRGQLSAPSTGKEETTAKTQFNRKEVRTLVLLGIYVVIQLLVPLRHYLYPGKSGWTGEGSNFAWHMKLGKTFIAELDFNATDPATGRTWLINYNEYLTRRQAVDMSIKPGMILQYVHHVAKDLKSKGYEDIEIRVRVVASLNYRKPELLIDPDVDLTKVKRTLLPNDWIMPVTNPVPTTREQSLKNLGLPSR